MPFQSNRTREHAQYVRYQLGQRLDLQIRSLGIHHRLEYTDHLAVNNRSSTHPVNNGE